MTGQSASLACSISQHAALAALTGSQDFVHDTRAVFERQRDAVATRLNRIRGLRCAKPAGAFYAFASCEGLIGRRSAAGRQLTSDEDVALALLDETGVAVMPGSAFGLGPYLRIAYALDEASLDKACTAIRGFADSTS